MSEYIVPAAFGEGELIEKRSRFIGRVWHIENESDALSRIKEMREKHWDATHNVYAYSVKEGSIARFSDDGEPSGTSGMPVLNVFRSAGVEDFCCVVTRYFGGVLLGAGGLVRAYSKSASLALEAAGRAEMKALRAIKLSCSYAQYERIRTELERSNAEISGTDFAGDVKIFAFMPEENAGAFEKRLTELTSGQVRAVKTGETVRPVKIS